MTTTQRTGKHDAKGNELVLSHYSTGVWKVLGLEADGTTAWFIPYSSKREALACIEWIAAWREESRRVHSSGWPS